MDGSHDELLALRESEERLRLLLANVGDAVFMVDTRGRVMTWTPAAERILGYAEHEALQLSLVDFLPPGPRDEQVTAALLRARESGRVEMDGWRVGKHGPPFWAHVVTCPIYGPDRQLRGFAKILQDRTELKRAQEKAAATARELLRSNRELEEFAGIAAHDLQEPLRKLRVFADRLHRRYGTTLEPDALQLVERLVETAARMYGLIDDLLSYSSITHAPHKLVPVDLEHVVGSAIEELSPAIETSQARVVCRGLPTIQANPVQMRQLFQNLISNAIKFARDDVPPEVLVSGRRVGPEEWEITVKDNGQGFDSKYADRIFVFSNVCALEGTVPATAWV